MSTPEKTRKDVSDAYAKAIRSGAGCCSSSSCCSPIGAVGYDQQLTRKLPAEAVGNSFGCGNPLAFAGVRSGEVVLDLGSGAGLDLLIASELVGPQGRVIGIDMTDAMLEKARQNIAASGATNVEVRKGIIEDLPVESVSVDWVISNCVINLSPEKEKVFSEIHRVLKPGGKIQISDIVARDLPDWARHGAGLVSACVGGAISEEHYIAGLQDAGLQEVRVLERFIYDRAQILGLISEISPDMKSAMSDLPVDMTIGELADELVGKVWSAKFHATKAR